MIINSFEQIKQIASGWKKSLLNEEEELSKKRTAICKQCPLYTNDAVFHGKCDSGKCFDTKEMKLVPSPGPNIVCGCGCKIDAKSRLKNAKCVLNKW